MRGEPKGALLPRKLTENRRLRDLYDGAIFLAALLIVAFRWEVIGLLVFLGIIGVTLVLSDRLSDIFLPLILMTVFVTRLYNSFDTFVKYIPFYAVVLACVAFHLIYYFAKPQLGESFPGLLAVTAAVTLGGVGSLSAAAYFRPMNLYYVLCLGILMPVLYIVAKPRVNDEARDRFLRGLFLAGWVAALMVLIFYVRDGAKFQENHRALTFHPSNNLATFLMISLPVGFHLSKKHRPLIAAPLLQYGALLLCNSRGGMLLGTLEFFALLVFFCFYRADRFRRVFFISTGVLCLVLFFVLFPKILYFLGYDLKIENFSELSTLELIRETFRCFVGDEEARVGLLQRSFADFKSNPLFGTGLGYTGNEDLYHPVKGAMNWYHMWAPQIWGSLGIVGVLGYGYQIFLRARLAFTRRKFPEVTLSLCYAGLLLMSQVNPGEFCPFPYAVIGTLIFLFLDAKPKSAPVPAPTEEKPTEEAPSDEPSL